MYSTSCLLPAVIAVLTFSTKRKRREAVKIFLKGRTPLEYIYIYIYIYIWPILVILYRLFELTENYYIVIYHYRYSVTYTGKKYVSNQHGLNKEVGSCRQCHEGTTLHCASGQPQSSCALALWCGPSQARTIEALVVAQSLSVALSRVLALALLGVYDLNDTEVKKRPTDCERQHKGHDMNAVTDWGWRTLENS